MIVRRIISIVTLVGLCAVCPASAAPKSLKVGTVLGLSGIAARHSDGIQKGMQLAKQELERSGWKIELNFQDDQTDPKKTIASFQFLLSSGYTHFIGPGWDFQITAVAPLLRETKAVTLVPINSAEIVGGSHPHMIFLSPARQLQHPLVVDWLKDKQGPGLILLPHGAWGDIHDKLVSGAFRAAVPGIEPLKERFDLGSDASVLKNLLLRHRAAGLKMLFVTGSGLDSVNLIRARNTLLPGIPILTTDDLETSLADRVLSVNELHDRDAILLLKMGDKFTQAYQAMHGEKPKLYSDRGYDSLMVLAKAVESTDGTAHAVREFVRNKFEFEGASGKLIFDENADVTNGLFEVVLGRERKKVSAAP